MHWQTQRKNQLAAADKARFAMTTTATARAATTSASSARSRAVLAGKKPPANPSPFVLDLTGSDEVKVRPPSSGPPVSVDLTGSDGDDDHDDQRGRRRKFT